MIRSLSPALILVALAIVSGGPAVDARWQASPAVPGAGLVPVDVHVLDRNGKPVTGLTQADFTVLEDGVPQQIRSLSPVALTEGTGAADAAPVLRKGISLVPQDHRIFVFALGLGRLEDPSGSISGLAKLVRTRLLPQDRVAIFAYDRALNFTTNHQAVADALERFRKGHPDVDFELQAQLGPTGMAALYGSRALPKKVQAKIDQLIVGPGAPPPTPFTGDNIQPQEFGRMTLDDFMASCAISLDDQSSLMTLMEYLRHFEGQKHVVFVTEKGLQSSSDENDRVIASLANDARVSVHSILAGGMGTPLTSKELESSWQLAVASRSLRAITDLTGGLPAIYDKGPAALDRLDEVTRSGYLLGYQASNAAWDGSYRNIVVRVNRPDVTVLYRHGYYRQPSDGAFDRRGAITNDRLSAGANFRREVNDLKMKVSVSPRGSTQLLAEGRLDPSKVKLASVGGNRVGLLNVAVYCFDGASNPTGVYTDTLPVKIPEADYPQALKDGFAFSLPFPMVRGTRNIRFVVYDFGSDLVGRIDTRVF